MQVYVQTSMRTTFPCKLAAVNGCELSHSVALLSEDNSPTDGCACAGISMAVGILCIMLFSSARVAIEAALAPASMVTSTIFFPFMMCLHFEIPAPLRGRVTRLLGEAAVS